MDLPAQQVLLAQPVQQVLRVPVELSVSQAWLELLRSARRDQQVLKVPLEKRVQQDPQVTQVSPARAAQQELRVPVVLAG
jgi:hypothetical protein